MKTRNFEKKLTLKKETISQLNSPEMHQVQGGTGITLGTFLCKTLRPGRCGDPYTRFPMLCNTSTLSIACTILP